ncbi:MAG: transglutaminase family protein [Gammaproteobacteria bacterium]
MSAASANNLHRYTVVHDTRCMYSAPVTNGHHFAHLTPRNTPWQHVLEHRIEFEPEPAEVTRIVDYFGNHSLSFLINRPHTLLQVRAVTTLDVKARNLDTALAQAPWESALCTSVYTVEPMHIAEMRLASPHVELLDEARGYAQRLFTPRRPWLDALLDLTQHIHADFAYDPQATTVSTPVREVFNNRRGVCQDFAHLMLGCLRALKLPARYVSGYILNEPLEGMAHVQGADASHAWIESHVPGLGWVGFDPTNGKLANHEFITMAWGRDFMDVTPLRGIVLGGGEQTLDVIVSVKRG